MKHFLTLMIVLAMIGLSPLIARAQSATATPSITPTATATPLPAVMPSSPLYPGGSRVYVAPPPYAQVASVTGSAGEALNLALPTVQGFTTVLYGFDLSCGAPTTTVSGALSVTGVRGSAAYEITESASTGTYLPMQQAPISEATSSTPIAFSFGAVSGGAACALNAYYNFRD